MTPKVPSNGLKISARVKAQIAMNEDALEILENTQSIETEIKDGNNFECQAFTNAGDRFKTKVKNKTHQLSARKETTDFKLLSETSNGVLGKWGNVEIDDLGSTTTTLIISRDGLEIIVDCLFY